MKINRFVFYLLLAAAWMSPPYIGRASACTQLYPDTDITAEIGRTQYRQCNIEFMVGQYAERMQNMDRLLATLRSAYIRQLTAEVASQSITADEKTARVTDYDTTLTGLSSARTALLNWISAIPPNDDNGQAPAITPEMKATLKQRLKTCKQSSRALKRKIQQAQNVVTDAESDDYCNLDFQFRFADKLKTVINDCL